MANTNFFAFWPAGLMRRRVWSGYRPQSVSFRKTDSVMRSSRIYHCVTTLHLPVLVHDGDGWIGVLLAIERAICLRATTSVHGMRTSMQQHYPAATNRSWLWAERSSGRMSRSSRKTLRGDWI